MMTDDDKAREFAKRTNIHLVDIRRMETKRTTTVTLSYCGVALGSKTTVYKQGKAVSTNYHIPEIHPNVAQRLKGYSHEPQT